MKHRAAAKPRDPKPPRHAAALPTVTPRSVATDRADTDWADIAALPASARRRFDSPWRVAGAALMIALTISLVAVASAIFVVPRVVGGTSLTVLTGSMQPTLKPGDVVVVRGVAPKDVCQDVKVGQIITFLPKPDDPTLITHRVVSKTIGAFDDGTSCRLTTRGDANSADDEPISPIQVRGAFMYGVPKLGWARQWISDHRPVVAAIGAGLFVAYLLWMRARPKTTRVVKYQRQPVSGRPEDAADDADSTATAAGAPGIGTPIRASIAARS
ncbi:MAG: signal peptidase I [Actinomycetia bacterium]|nr:signal peptidase I [Actinomycetes bacterium]